MQLCCCRDVFHCSHPDTIGLEPAGAGSTVRGARSLLSSPIGAVASSGDTAMADAAPADDDEAALPNGGEETRRNVARLAADAATRRAAQTASPAGAALAAAEAHTALGEANTAASWKEAARQEAGKADAAALNRQVERPSHCMPQLGDKIAVQRLLHAKRSTCCIKKLFLSIDLPRFRAEHGAMLRCRHVYHNSI